MEILNEGYVRDNPTNIAMSDEKNYLEGYDSLSDAEKMELDKFTALVYDTATTLGKCLNQTNAREKPIVFRDYEAEEYHTKKGELANERKDCTFSSAYLQGALEAGYKMGKKRR